MNDTNQKNQETSTTNKVSNGKIPKFTAIALSYGMLVSSIGNNFLITIMPPLGRELGFIEWQIGVVLAVGGLLLLLTGPIWGKVSEAKGRKNVMLFGAIGYVITSGIFAVLIDLRIASVISIFTCFILLVVIRSIYTITSGAIYPASIAMAADLTSKKNRSGGLALITASWGFGSVIGPAIAAVFTIISPTAPFYAVTIMGILAVYLYYAIPEPKKYKKSKNSGFRKVLTKEILTIQTGFTILILGNVSMIVILGFYFQDKFHLNTIETARYVGIALSVSAISQICIQVFVLPKLKWSPKKLINFGLPLAITATLIVMSTDSYIVIILAMVIFGMGGAVGWPAYMTASSFAAGKDNQGNVAGLTSAFQAFSFMTGPLLGTVAYQYNNFLPFYLCIFCLCLSILMANTTKMPDLTEE